MQQLLFVSGSTRSVNVVSVIDTVINGGGLMNKRGFYDIECGFDDGAILKSWGVDELFYLRNLQNRKLYLQ